MYMICSAYIFFGLYDNGLSAFQVVNNHRKINDISRIKITSLHGDEEEGIDSDYPFLFLYWVFNDIPQSLSATALSIHSSRLQKTDNIFPLRD